MKDKRHTNGERMKKGLEKRKRITEKKRERHTERQIENE